MVPAGSYGVHPRTGEPYSDKSKMAAALLQILVPIGIGRFYTGHTKIGIFQLLACLACGAGTIWSIVDGVMILMNDAPTDAQGRPLRP